MSGDYKIYTGHIVTGMFFAPTGLSHPNYTEVLLPDMQEDAMSNITRWFITQYTIVGLSHPSYTEVLLPDMQEDAMSNITRWFITKYA